MSAREAVKATTKALAEADAAVRAQEEKRRPALQEKSAAVAAYWAAKARMDASVANDAAEKDASTRS